MADDQHTGGMLALIPDDPEPLSVDGGHEPGELHLTLLYLGDDVSTWTPEQTDRLRELVEASAPGLDAVEARIMGRAVFNPDGGPDGDRDPMAVYLVGDAPDLTPVRDWARWVTTEGEDYVTPPEQFEPYIPHVSAREGADAGALTYAGPMRFGTLRLALAGERYDFPLGVEPESDQPDTPEPENKGLTFVPPHDVRDEAARARGAMAHQVYEGKALDGAGVAWVAEHCGEPGQRWAAAMMRRAETKDATARRRADEEDHDEPEIVRAPPFDDEELPRPRKRRKFGEGRAVREKPGAIAPGGGDGWSDLIGETKAMSPDPRAARLRRYWAYGAGRAKWAGNPHPFRALRRQLRKHVKNPRVLNGLTANIFKLAKGVFPGQRPHGGRKTLIDWVSVETKAAALPDADEAALCEGIDDWGQVFASEDLSGYSPEDFADDGDMDGDGGEGKALDVDDPLARYQRLGERMVPDDEDDEDLESWEEIVARGDEYQMDADGVMHRVGEEHDDEEPVSLFGPGAWTS